MSENRFTGGEGVLAGLMKAKPAKPGEIYGVPGQGESYRISAVVIVLLFAGVKPRAVVMSLEVTDPPPPPPEPTLTAAAPFQYLTVLSVVSYQVSPA